MATPLKFKFKQVPTDVWSIREKLCLASSVMRSGDQNWVSVSRAIKVFGEPNRPPDWFNQKNCALQYSDLLEKVETPKRKRGEREIETPGESIVKKLTQERIEELTKTTEEYLQKYKKIKLQHDQVASGMLDGQLQTIWQQILEEKKQAKEEEEKHEKWLLDRKANIAAIASMKSAKIPAIPIAKQKKGNKPNRNMRRNSSQSDHGSESEGIANSPMDETVKIEHVVIEETSTNSSVPEETTKASPMPPTSPLLTSLLKNPSPATTHPGFGALQSVIAPQKDETIEKPNIPPSSTTVFSKSTEESPPKTTHLSPSAGAPTLSRLLELPLTSPGRPLPSLPLTSTIATTSEIVETTNEIKDESPLPKSPIPPIDTVTQTIIDDELSLNEVQVEPEAETEVITETEIETYDKDSTCETIGTEELSVSTDRVEEQATSPKVQDEVAVVEEVISFQDDQDVQTNVEIQEENEIEIEVPEDVHDVCETVETEEIKPQAEEAEEEEETDIPVEEKPQIPVETEPAQPVEEQQLEVEEKPIEPRDPSPTIKQMETPKSNRGKRERGHRRTSGTRSEKTTLVKTEDVATIEPVIENTETSDKETKEKLVDKKPSEDKTRGRKPKRRRETKESSDDSNEGNTTKRKQPPRRERRKTESISKRTRRFKQDSSSSSDEDEKSEVKEEIAVKMEVPFDSIPNSPSSLSHSDDPDSLRDYKLWKKAIMLVWRSAANHKYANVFLHPVTDDVAPGYSSVVYRSMDLSQIKKGIESGAIKTTSDFQRDMMLMFQNAIMYNSSDHDVFHMAVEMQKEVENHIQDFLATQLMAQTTEAPKNLRRETRELSHKRTASSDYRDRVERSTPEIEGSKTKKRRTRAAEHDSTPAK